MHECGPWCEVDKRLHEFLEQEDTSPASWEELQQLVEARCDEMQALSWDLDDYIMELSPE